jgi:hypothetical protein
MKRTLAITMLFVVVNGLGVVYRVVVNKGDPAGAVMAPISPAMASERVPERVPIAPPTLAAPTPVPSASETETPGPQGNSQSSEPKLTGEPAAGSRPIRPTTAPSKVRQQRQPSAESHPASLARPRPAAPDTEPASAPPPFPVVPPTPAKPDNHLRTEDSLKKMEANPYKRGE